MNDKNLSSSNLIDLASFRAKKELNDDLAGGRKPLYISHLDGKLSGSPHLNRPTSEDFGDRISRIKSSLEKINRLMAELKKISNREPKKEDEDAKAPVSILTKS